MTKETQFLLGFDRFIQLDWANYALDLRLQHVNSQAGRETLKKYLAFELQGETSIRKTTDLLRRLWFDPCESKDLMDQALLLAQENPFQNRVALHWGIAITRFPFFRDTVSIIGRLFALQDDAQKSEITSRVEEKYGNKGSVPRAVNRIIQTLADWEILQVNKGVVCPCYVISKTIPEEEQRWLLEVVSTYRIGNGPVEKSTTQFPELYPFR